MEETTTVKPLHPGTPRAGIGFPVLVKEMRSRMRGHRAPVLLAVVTGLLILVGMLILNAMNIFAGYISSSAANSMPEAGKALFVGLVAAEGILITLIAPALTAGAISIEQEKQTLEMLLLTRLSNLNIILGKFTSSLGFMVLLLFCALPVMAISFLLGGVDPAQVAWAFALLLSVALCFGAVGLYFSTRCRKTVTAVTLTYPACLTWLLLIPFLTVCALEFSQSSDLDTGIIILYTILMALLAAVPTILFAGLCASIPRCSLSAVSQLILWLAVTAAGATLFFFAGGYDAITSKSELSILSITGNPIFAVVVLGYPDEVTSGGVWSVPTWYFDYFVLISVALHLLGAYAFTAFTTRRLRMVRRGK